MSIGPVGGGVRSGHCVVGVHGIAQYITFARQKRLPYLTPQGPNFGRLLPKYMLSCNVRDHVTCTPRVTVCPN